MKCIGAAGGGEDRPLEGGGGGAAAPPLAWPEREYGRPPPNPPRVIVGAHTTATNLRIACRLPEIDLRTTQMRGKFELFAIELTNLVAIE
jgi:hypothetical protein